MAKALADDFGAGASAAQSSAWINLALDYHLAFDSTSGSRVRDWEIARLAERALGFEDAGAEYDDGDLISYADAIRATRLSNHQKHLTPIGRLILELPDKDAIRWMLAAEVIQSRGVDDQWRLSRRSATFLLEHPEGSCDIHDEDPDWAIHWNVLQLLSQRGITEISDPSEAAVAAYELLPLGRRLLEEIASGTDTPFILLVQALLHDETSVVLGQFAARAGAPPRESTTDVTARHARMVAHEIRNALVPVQSAVESLYRDLDREGKGALADRRRGGIDAGIERIFRFLQDISSIANLASAPSDLFEIGGAVSEAIAAIAADLDMAIPFDSPAVLPAVRGHRDRFALAVVNVLRNAAQSRDRDGLQIRVSAGTRNGAEVYVAVEDNGPGVPVEHRATIFEPGFSLRPQGSGQGLALVREVIESEMAGQAVCEQSDLGGARIVLRLPVGSKRKL